MGYTTMIKVAIAGGTGYTAGELLRLLINHPNVEVIAVLSTSMAGEPLYSVHRDLIGDTTLKFSSSLESEEGTIEPDILFLTLGHALSVSYLDTLSLSSHTKIIDLGNDFRLGEKYRENSFIYGLCEKSREQIKGCSFIANPGCFATSILLALLPLFQAGVLNNEVHISAVTGSTGAGKSLSQTSHFSYRHANFSAYKPFSHQHLGEITHCLSSANPQNRVPRINFIPFRGDFSRGIFTSIHTEVSITIEEVNSIYTNYYKESPFVYLSPFPISLKEVVNTNKTLLYAQKYDNYLHITSALDNLLKGASGQAVQNMNLMFGLEESTGLKLKGTLF